MAYPVKQMFSNNVSTMGMPIEHYELAAKTSEMSGIRISETRKSLVPKRFTIKNGIIFLRL